MQADATRVYSLNLLEGLRPDLLLSVSEWSDEHRYLSSRASAEPGKWRTLRTPYLKAVMDALSSTDSTREIIFMKGAQIGATECGNNWIGYVIDHSPAPLMVVLPTTELAKRSSKQRISPLIDECPRLKEKVKPARSRDSGNTILMKEFPGGVMVLTGANSAVGLRSLPARYLFLDEVDAYPGDVDGEGDPVELACARARTFSRRKVFVVSTPTISGRSRIESSFEQTDKRYFFVPCPHCGFYQCLTWDRVKWEENKVSEVHYLCISCEKKIEEHHKTGMLECGEWRATKKAAFPDVIGFHLSALYSPIGWFSWADAAKLWIEAQGKPEKLRSFVNTVLGETWKERGEAPDWKRLYERRETYETGAIPSPHVVFITAGVDVQKDRLEIEIVGWGRDKQSWSIDFIVVPGDTSTDAPWQEVDKLVTKTWSHTTGLILPLKMMAVDSGYNTQHVYNWVRRHPMNRVMAVKGKDPSALLLGAPSAVDVNLLGNKIRRGVRLWPVGVGVAKGELYSWLKQDKPIDGEKFPTGFCHFPQYGDEYFKQLTSEQLVVRIVKGHRKYEWEKTRDRNEALDCRIYARAAAAAVGMDRFNDEHWDQLQGISGEVVEKADTNGSFQKKESFYVNKSEEEPRRESWLRRR